MSLPFTSAPQRLCLFRLSAVGDVCHTVPVVRRIQHFWPTTKITWVIGKLEHSLVGDLPGIEFIIFDKSSGLAAYQSLRQVMQGRQFDVLLQLQVSLRASLASLFIPAEIKLGFDRQRAKDYQWIFSNQKIAAVANQHVMDGLFEFTRALGIKDNMIEWNIPIPDDAMVFARDLVSNKLFLSKTKPKQMLLISPCSSNRFRNWRNWSAKGYAQIIDFAYEYCNMQTVLTGGPSLQEKTMGENIVKLAKYSPINIIGKTDLKQLLAVIKQAQVLVSPDSGPAHMATTVGTPVIGLYVTSNPARTGPYLSQQWVVNKYAEAIISETGKTVDQVPWGARVRNANAMARIEVQDVTKKLQQLINKDNNSM